MGGKKKSVPEVPDFLMSVDFGVCAGPVDTINRVRVKGKSIFCGAISEREDVRVDLPKLFGSDSAEGGVDGVVEVYMGSDDQKMSEKLSGKYGLTPDTAPGYRGLVHLFFRGKRKFGFKWSTNNPYMPETDVSVTRKSPGLSDDYAFIYPFSHYDDAGNPVQVSPFLSAPPMIELSSDTADGDNPGTVMVDLVAEGATPASLKSGVMVNFAVRGYCKATALAGGGDAHGWVRGVINFFDKDNNPIGSDYVVGPYSGYGALEASVIGVESPPDTYYVQLIPTWGRTVPIASYWQSRSTSAAIDTRLYLGGSSGTKIGPTAHCDIYDQNMKLLPNSNPSNIIYECMVNAEWGKGEVPSNIDVDSHTIAAETLYNELFGMSLIWVRQSEIEAFIQEVLDHIQAVYFQHPRTGLWTIKLLRGDYNINVAPSFDETNSRAADRKRRAWGETINEIVVEWTDPRTEETATVARHHMANIAIQGGVNSETRNYHGVRDPWLASVIAERDVREAGYPLYSATLSVGREFWDVVPGDVAKFSWAEDGIENMIVRILSVDYGSPKDRTIKLEVVEDVFSLSQTEYGDLQETEWVTDRVDPEALAAQTALPIPLPLLTRAGQEVSELDDEFPTVYVGLLGADASGNTVNFEAHTTVVGPTGTSEVKSVKTVPPVESITTSEALSEEVRTTLSGALVDDLMLGAATPGRLIMCGTTEAAHELMMLDTYDDVADTWDVLRGVWDTIPRPWPIGTRLWDFPMGQTRVDPHDRAGGETRAYRFLPGTTESRIAFEDAAEFSTTFSNRPHLPFRPANVQLDGMGFGGTVHDHPDDPVTMEATWANRHRATEDSIALDWDDATVAGEPGQTTVLQIYDDAGVLQNEVTGLTGTSYTITVADRAGTDLGFVRFLSERDGLRSLMGADRNFDFRLSGYGLGYGQTYK